MARRPPARRAGRPVLRVLAGLTITAVGHALVRGGVTDRLDERAGRLVARPLGERADVMIAAGTDLGSVYGMAGVAAALAIGGQRSTALDVAAGGMLAWVAAQAVKPLLRRERPYELATAPRLVAVPAGSAWPSGHAAVATAMASAISRRSSRPAAAAAWGGVALVGVSRLYVGVHHLTDVVAGVGVGLVASGVWSAARSTFGSKPASAV